ncbi:hypothetical protein MGG_17161 [Pyricularia oryzae 70-15]|uniref:Uncharacterized protein n=3 Tax=Pyricularia oryzae TaxID=318829 RepID=G4N6A9_PYRO7|nr:uncharacterized protein MGG_17161 [Pyricularia oryzae 70-15]EHA50631.1 hypothetical protein MGG_17161 [Pyricularia oryzae 70-15]ELQ42950.1 hypothetical protein OOU_Y34scaffold00182g20 [Pyricularia oryzae Y34]
MYVCTDMHDMPAGKNVNAYYQASYRALMALLDKGKKKIHVWLCKTAMVGETGVEWPDPRQNADHIRAASLGRQVGTSGLSSDGLRQAVG